LRGGWVNDDGDSDKGRGGVLPFRVIDRHHPGDVYGTPDLDVSCSAPIISAIGANRDTQDPFQAYIPTERPYIPTRRAA